MAHKHNVKDADLRFAVSPFTKAITSESKKNILAQGDHNSEKITFDLPRLIESHDMSLCNFVLVNYINIDSTDGRKNEGSYEVTDLAVLDTDATKVTCSWLVSREATMYAGNLSFSLSFMCKDENGIIEYAWNTLINSDISVGECLNNSEVIAEKYADILAQWESKLFSISDNVERSKAPAIVLTAEGGSVVVHDSSDCYLKGLRVFGKSTQNGTPTPSAPVEIEGVGPDVCVSIHRRNIAFFENVEGKEESGITWGCKDGVFTATGTSTAISATGKIAVCNLTGCVGTFFISGSTAKAGVFAAVDKGGVMSWHQEKSFTLDGTENSVVVYCQIAKDVTVSNEKVYPMLNIGNSAAEWEKGEAPQTLPILNKNGLHGIPVTSGGNYTDANGQQWICDEVDLKRGVYVQRLKRLAFTGAENWYAHDTVASMFILWLADCSINGMKYPTFNTHYAYTPIELANVDVGQRFNNNGEGEAFLYYVKDANISTVEGFKAKLAEYAAAGNPMEIVYQLFHPVETALSDAEITAFKALHSNYPNTTVLNDAGAYMAVEYVADTKTYIDNKFAELMQS